MARVIVSPKARRDLDEIDRYRLAQFGGPIADEYMQGFRGAFQRLAEFPESGPVFSEVTPPIRRLTYRSHNLFYDFDGKTIVIVRVLHHAMNAKTRLR
jgi:toxin ParE1/3/4